MQKPVGYVIQSLSTDEFSFLVPKSQESNIIRNSYTITYQSPKRSDIVLSRIDKISQEPDQTYGVTQSKRIRKQVRLDEEYSHYIAECKVLTTIDSEGVIKSLERPIRIRTEVYRPTDEQLQSFFKMPTPHLKLGTIPHFPNVDFSIPIDAFSKTSTLIAGMTGSGKTRTVLTIIRGLIDYNFACIVLDLTGEYRESLGKAAKVFVPTENFMIPFNSEFISSLSGSAGLSSQQSNLLFSVYSHFGEDMDGILKALLNNEVRANKAVSTQVANVLLKVAKSHIISNPKDAGKCQSEIPLEKGITVVDLSKLTFEGQTYVIAYLLTHISGRANKRSPLPTYIILEDAHLFASNSEIEMRSALDAAESIVRTGRTSGINLCLVTARPSFCDPALLSNCGLQLIHKIQNISDIQGILLISEFISEDLAVQISTLKPGETIVFGSSFGFPTAVRVK